jgi:molybdopterin synthase sulfur carrier subunit
MKLLYFAWLRERIGLSEETVTPPADVRDVAGLVAWLKTRGDNYAAALKSPEAIRVAVNQAYARGPDPVGPDDEIALFPPVTGGDTPP